MASATADSTVASISGSSTFEPVFSGPRDTVECSAATLRRRRFGSTWSSLASALALLSWMPCTPVPARRPIATAIASSSSSSSGGMFAPAASR
jgi:hypothetical protein